MVSATPGSTPFRDQLNINQDLSAHQSLDRDALRKQLGALPKPKNDFEIVLPEEESVEEEPTEVCATSVFHFSPTITSSEIHIQEWEVDAAELDERRQQLLAKKREAEMKKRSQPMQRSLPIPSKLNESYKKRSQAPTEHGKVSLQSDTA